jgi:hypothetical protein
LIVKGLGEFAGRPRGWWDAARQEESVEQNTRQDSIGVLKRLSN